MTLLQGETGEWEMVIGLEVHAQVISHAKLFSGAATHFGAEPNAQVSFVDAAMPGMLPVINEFCVEQAVKTGLGLRARINRTSVFDRKNYFYPDLPPGYQISQYSQPIVGEGKIILDLKDGRTREVGITRLHMEQDAGKSLHDQHPSLSYIDLNRAGIALMEIVSEPDMRSAEEAGAYLRKLRSILRYLGTCDGNMDEGSMRCDANVSVRRPGEALGTRCEIKNVNSVRFLMQAVEYEARRQVELIESGGRVEQETRLFDSGKGETRSMRSKEFAHDYRYFPDPDLLPLVLEESWIEEIRAKLPELPDDKKARFVERLGLNPYQAGVLVADKEVADAFEKRTKDLLRLKTESEPKFSAVDKYISSVSAEPIEPEVLRELHMSASSTATMVLGSVFARANETNESVADLIEKLDLPGLINLVDQDVISGRIAKDVFEEMCKTGRAAADIVEEKGLKQVSDTGELEGIAAEVVAAHPDQAAQFKEGNEKVVGWFVGQVMKATGGKANPKLVNEILRKKLAE